MKHLFNNVVCHAPSDVAFGGASANPAPSKTVDVPPDYNLVNRVTFLEGLVKNLVTRFLGANETKALYAEAPVAPAPVNPSASSQ